MKGLLILVTVAALALLIGASQTLAQTAATTTPPPAKGAKVMPGKVMGGWHGGFRHFRYHRRPMLGEKLGLTDQQKEQVKTILKAAREQTQVDRKAAFEKIKTTVLTDEQRKTLADLKAKIEARRGEKPATAKPAPAVPAKP